MKSRSIVFLTLLGLILGGLYGMATRPALSAGIPNGETLDGEGSGTTIPGSKVTLLQAQDDTVRWSVIRYRTTEFECADMDFASLPDSTKLGGFGSCGPDLTATMPVSTGLVRDGFTGVLQRGAFGIRVPLDTATVRVTLTNGSTLETAVADGAWMIRWTQDAEMSTVEALSSSGGLIKRCAGPCVD